MLHVHILRACDRSGFRCAREDYGVIRDRRGRVAVKHCVVSLRLDGLDRRVLGKMHYMDSINGLRMGDELHCKLATGQVSVH
jgi:hypothetical protein